MVLVFLDICKAFDKVWRKGLVYKLQQNVISDKLLDILKDFINNRKPRVVLNDQSFSWLDLNPRVLQGSIMGSLLFLIYINGFLEGLITNAKLFTDNALLFLVIQDIAAVVDELNNDLINISRCGYWWKITFNFDLTKQPQEEIFSREITKPSNPNLNF